MNIQETEGLQSETDYQALFKFASDGIFIADSQGNYTDANEIGLKMLGYSLEELLKLNLKDLIPKDELEFNLQKFSGIRDGKIVSGEQYLICSNGNLLPVEISATILPNGSLLGMVRDITERKRLASEVSRLNRIYEVISKINQMVVRTNNTEQLFSEACRITFEYGKFRMAWIGRVEEGSNTVKPLFWSGFEDGYLKKIKIINSAGASEGNGPTGIAIREGHFSVSNDIAKDSFMLPWRDEALKRGYLSSISLPIISKRKTIAAFNIYAPETYFFNEKEIQSLLEVTKNIAYAYEKIEEEEKRKLAEETLKESEKSFIGLFNSVSEAIYIQDENGYFLSVNEGAQKMYGYSHDEFIGLTPEFLSAPGKNDLHQVVEKVQKVFITGVPETFEFWGKRKNGEIFPKEVICNKGKYFGKDVIIATARDITESKLAERALIESEEKFRTIFDKASDGIIMTNAKTKKFVMGNRMICKMLGYNLNELVHLSVHDIHPQEDLPSIIEGMENQLKSDNRIEVNLPVKRKDGSIFFADLSSSPQIINGETYLFGIFRDSTENKIAKEALQKSEEKFYSLFENARDPILLIDETSQFIACNEATIKILGAESKDQLLPIHPSYISPEYQPDGQLSSIKAEEMIQNGYKYGSTQFEWVHKKLDGTPIFMDISLTVIPIENKNILMVHWRDITSYKKVEEELRLSEERFKSIIEQAADGILLGSSKGIIVGANKQISIITGFSQDELIGKNISLLFSGKELEKSPLRYDLLNLGMVVRNERNITRKDGSLIPIEMNTKKMPDNSYYTYQAIIRDMTERKSSEELKLKIEKTEYENKVKSQFMANLSHEIRNPLNAIIGLNSLIAKTELNPDQEKYTNAINLSSNNLLNILNDILDVSKIEAHKTDLHFSDFNIRKTLGEIIMLKEDKAREKNIILNHTIAKEIPEFVTTDQNKLKQIIMNLMGNALKFTDRGTIDLKVELKQKTNDDIILEFIVKDTGIGIKQENFGKIFQSFTQLDSSTKKSHAGTGLGLSICKNYVELLGGDIGLTSNFGSGTEFSFRIPLIIGKSEGGPPSINLYNSNPFQDLLLDSAFRVLIAEDDAINRLYLTSLLKSKNFKVDTASNGFKALEQFKENKYDLILMDCQMPKMDGFEATKKIREFELEHNFAPTFIMALTGYAKNELSEKFNTTEMDDYIIKPINEAELFKKIMILVQKKIK